MDPSRHKDIMVSNPAAIENDPVAWVREAAAQRAVDRNRPSPMWKWLFILLVGSAITAFLGSESKRKKLMISYGNLEDELQIVALERAKFHDDWQAEARESKELAENLKEVEQSLMKAEQRSVTLVSEKAGLSRLIDDLKISLATAIGDHQRTEASLTKVISVLESKNDQLQASLSTESKLVADLQSKFDEITGRLQVAEASSKRFQVDNDALQVRVVTLTEALRQADTHEEELRNRVMELVAANQAITKTLSEQKQRLSEAQKELSANKVELIGERLAAHRLQNQLEVVTVALASTEAELESALQVYVEVPEPVFQKVESADTVGVETVKLPIVEDEVGKVSALGVDLNGVLNALGQSSPE